MKKLDEIFIDDSCIVRDKSSSDGAQEKYQKDGYWYKCDYYGGESEAEYLASLVLKNSNLGPEDYVTYQRCLLNGENGCVSRDFRKDCENENFVTLYRLYSNVYGKDLATVTSAMDYDDAIEYVIEFMKRETGLDIRTYLANLFYLDKLILNTDRHFNNMGVIFDGTKFRTAPIFDNGKSLLVGIKKAGSTTIETIESGIKMSFAKAFSPSFDLNYNYLKEYKSFEIDMIALDACLIQEDNSFEKDVLMYQIKNMG